MGPYYAIWRVFLKRPLKPECRDTGTSGLAADNGDTVTARARLESVFWLFHSGFLYMGMPGRFARL